MAIYKLKSDNIIALHVTTFGTEGILERNDLQRLLRERIDIISQDTLIIAEEFGDWEDSKRRVDLLGIDKSGKVVVIELKRTETGAHMELQAIRYAAMLSTITFNQAVDIYTRYLQKDGKTNINARETLFNFLEWIEPHEDRFATDVRMVLVSAEFSKELTTAVLWLNEKGLDIQCVRVKPYKSLDDGQVFIDVQQIIPLPEVKDYQIQVREKTELSKEAKRTEMARDYTRYIFEDLDYGKNRLVLAVVTAYLRDQPEATLADLQVVFPDRLQGGHGVFTEASLVLGNENKEKRYFCKPEEIITISKDQQQIVVCNQWGVNNIGAFISKAKGLGYEVVEYE